MNKFQKAIKTIKQFTIKHNLNGRIFITGGYLRDQLTSNISKDIDLLLIAPEEDAIKFISDLAISTNTEPYQVYENYGHGFQVILFTNTLYQIKADFLFDVSIPNDISVYDALIKSYYKRDFKMNALHMDIVSGKLFDIDGMGVSSIINKTIVTVSNDYKYTFWKKPHLLYKMFRLQSLLGYSIPTAQLEYVKENWWLANFIIVPRIRMEMRRICNYPYSNLAIENLKWCKLDPTDFTRSDIYLGEDWNECEPGTDFHRVTDEPHARWTMGTSTIFSTKNVTEIEIIAEQNTEHNNVKEVEILYDTNHTEIVKVYKNRIKFPTLNSRKIQLKMTTFNPAELSLSNDDRNLGVYVRKMILYKKDAHQEIPIEYIPFYLELQVL